ncbi:MAG TPA: hypothetical protein VN026_11870 [Bacteroidia bacterium]|jgi:hypothetical protein|nr:hypothetical protein [Bacteroidia bacterium]
MLIYFFVWRTDAVGYKTLIDGDGRDYYSYLMSIFIDKNLGHQDITPWYVIQTPTGTINVHTAGVSLLLLPFFLIGYVWAFLSGHDVNGISEPFQKMISFGGLFYALMGLYFIRKLLIKLNIKDLAIAITLILIFFGTHLLNYSLNEPVMSHVYSFALISAFLYYSYQIFNSGERKYFLRAAFVFGLIILVRPINGIALFIVPLWSNSFKEFLLKIKTIVLKQTRNVVLAVLFFFATVFIQAFVWLAQNGKIVQWSYKDNGLYFFSPNTLKMLFGFNAGFFIYTPLCLLLMLGLIPLFKENSYKFLVMTFFLLFMFYLFSCHWAYTYFDGLSIRPMVDFFGVFAILGAKLISSLEGKLKTVSLSAFGLFLVLNLITCYQYKAGILPPASMNYEKFKYVFLKTDKKYVGVLGGCDDLLPYSKKHPKKSFSYENKFDETEYYDCTNIEYAAGYGVSPLGFNTTKLYIKIKLKRKELTLNSSAGADIMCIVESPAHATQSLQVFKLNEIPSDRCCDWEDMKYNVTLDGKMSSDAVLKVFVWNREKKPFLIDDFKVEVYNYNYDE